MSKNTLFFPQGLVMLQQLFHWLIYVVYSLIWGLQVLDIREKELGADHVDVAASLNNIAVLLKTSGQFEEAEEMYNRSIAIKEKALGPNHPQVPALFCHPALASCYRLLHGLPLIGALVVSMRYRWAEMPNRSKQLVLSGIWCKPVKEACLCAFVSTFDKPSCVHVVSWVVLEASNLLWLIMQACSYPRP